MSTPRHWLCAAVPVTAAFFSLIVVIDALWIPAKSELAQWLIERSWRTVRAGGPERPPWPWADTRAIAVLEVPAHGIRQVMLKGNSGRNLAFGPVLTEGTAQGLDWIVSGHRDTHFHFLARLAPGDRINITTASATRWYRVAATDIIDSRHQELVIDPGMDRISLVTCYPFDNPGTGGPLRYVVTALPLLPASTPRPTSSG